MRKLLLYFSYMGTYYRGVQRRIPLNVAAADVDTVQGIIELGIRKQLSVQNARLILSSRTDAGVHATLNTAHLNLEDSSIPSYTGPENLCRALNLFLDQNETEIRVRRIVEVPESFSCRASATSRTYKYRIAVLKDNYIRNSPSVKRLASGLPLTELNRCHVVRQPFDPNAVFDACKVFVGTRNFRTFCGRMSSEERKEKLDQVPDFFVKTINRFSFSLMNTLNSIEACDWDPSYEEFEFYEFYIEGSGFVRRQVRRMVGTLLAVGNGMSTADDIKFMLENPSEKSWNSDIESASAGGLYLKSVNYEEVPVLRGYIS